MSRPALGGRVTAYVNAGGSVGSVVKSLILGTPTPREARARNTAPTAARGLDHARHARDEPYHPTQREEPEAGDPRHDPEPRERRPDHEERAGDHPEGVAPARSRRPVVHGASLACY